MFDFCGQICVKVDIVKNTFLEKQTEKIKSVKQNFDFRSLICVKPPMGHQAASTEKSAHKNVAEKREKTSHLWHIVFSRFKWTWAPRRFRQNLPNGSLGPYEACLWDPTPQGPHFGGPGLHFLPQSDHFLYL